MTPNSEPIAAQSVDLPDNGKSTIDQLLLAFYYEVCDQAERNMEMTGTVSGAHWNAMRQILKAKGIEVSR